ncbi:MAG: YggS family pyridoxal phosphate-dependent enzyme [Candidatus Cryosericum sp.]
MGSIAERLAEVRERACLSYRRAGGQPGELHIVCVTKTHTLPRIQEAIDAGATEIGENYLQEAIRKDVFSLCESRKVTVRYIGRLQSNKFNAILRAFDAIDSASPELLEHVHGMQDCEARKAHTFLLEVNAGEESQKGGLTIQQIHELAAVDTSWLHEISGLMAVVPLQATMQMRARMYESVSLLFQELARDLSSSCIRLLSMGTSDDFEVAIEHGSNMIRIGTAIFGPRSSFPQ